MQLDQHRSARRCEARLSVGLATCKGEVLEAEKLRYRVFVEELGARLDCRIPGVDRDVFDPFCDHLLVRDEAQGRIVGQTVELRRRRPARGRRAEAYLYALTAFKTWRTDNRVVGR